MQSRQGGLRHSWSGTRLSGLDVRLLRRHDRAHGGPGDDIMVDFRGSNFLKGESGNDIIITTDFNIDEIDTLFGGDGDLL